MALTSLAGLRGSPLSITREDALAEHLVVIAAQPMQQALPPIVEAAA